MESAHAWILGWVLSSEECRQQPRVVLLFSMGELEARDDHYSWYWAQASSDGVGISVVGWMWKIKKKQTRHHGPWSTHQKERILQQKLYGCLGKKSLASLLTFATVHAR
jgi:hypothetical protein